MTSGIYIHIPFCRSRCNYCHFVSRPFTRPLAGRYHGALLREVESFARRPARRGDCGIIDSIYFGGGTPSIVPAAHIAELLRSCRRLFHVADDCEISLEGNPGTITPRKVVELRECGVNRISLGAQSFSDSELRAIGRSHTAAMIRTSLARLRDGGFTNINLDLMLGLPGQTAATWRATLRAVESLGVPHLSIYMLDLDEQCPLQELVAAGSVRLPEDDLISDLYLETLDFLSGCGYIQYEISNFARAGYACRHNLKYWQREPVYGFGLGSHSFDGRSRYANIAELDAYLETAGAGRNPVNWSEPVRGAGALAESLFLGLRLTRGVDWNGLKRSYGSNRLVQYEARMRELSEKGLVQWQDSTVRLTASGMLLSNEVFQVFI